MHIVTPAARVRAHIDRIVGTGVIAASRDKRTIRLCATKREAYEALHICVFHRLGSFSPRCGLSKSEPLSANRAAVEKSLQDSSGWFEPFRMMILGGENNIFAGALYMLPVSRSLGSQKGWALDFVANSEDWDLHGSQSNISRGFSASVDGIR
jgi:hypothetical protein